MNNIKAMPDFSIIIITHNRNELVKRCIHSIKAAAGSYCGKTELIVVNSSKEPLGINNSWTREIHVPHIPKPYKKRNMGAEESKFEWLLYLDDDCIVDGEILNVFAERILKSDEKVGGFYGVTEFFGETTYASRCCADSSFTYIFKAPAMHDELVWAAAVAPLFRKKAYMDVKGFTEEFSSPVGGEDLDIGVKLNEKGWVLKGIPKTLSYHGYETWNSYSGNLKRFFRYGMAETGIVRNHPKHTFLKLNALLFLVLPVIIDSVLFYSGLISLIAEAAVFLLITTIFSAIYYKYENKIPLYYAVGVVFYDRAFELGTTYSSIITGNFKALFSRFEYQKKKRLLGSNTGKRKIALELLSVILTLCLYHAFKL